MRLNRRDFLKALGVAVGGLVAWTKGTHQAQSELLSTDGQAGKSGIAGTVTNIVNGQPIAGAVIGVSARVAVADRLGRYILALPPGTYEIRAQAHGFVDMARVRQEVSPAAILAADFELVPLNPSEQDARIIYDKLVAAPENPPLAAPSQLPKIDAIAPAVTVPSTIVVDINGQRVTMGLDEYLKGVVPYEMPSSWPPQALKAQAVAARSYAVVYYQANGYICTTTSCQVYGNNRYASTNTAVDETSGQVVTYVSSNGERIASTYFFSRCNGQTTRNSEDAVRWQDCSRAGWNYVSYARAKSCTGHDRYSGNTCGYYGHGVGMCQWGAKARADEGWDYLRILNYYYTSVTILGTTLTAPVAVSPANGQFIITGNSVTLSWGTRADSTYYAEAQSTSGSYRSQSGPTSSTSWNLGALSRGMYQWRVKAKNAYGESAFSDYYYFIIADTVQKTYFPRVDKGSTTNW